MMATLLEGREIIKRFYAKNDIYVKMAIKFILAFVSFLMISSKIGFMQQLRGPLVAMALAAVCTRVCTFFGSVSGNDSVSCNYLFTVF